MIRELASLFSRTLTERRAAPRRKYHVPVKVCFAPERNPNNLTAKCDEQFLSGETTDVSESGIGFIVSAIRVKEKYLVGQDRPLNVELDIAGRKIRMQVMGVRYERVGIHSSTEKYLIGARITDMSADDKRKYEFFLQNGKKLQKNVSPAFEMGID